MKTKTTTREDLKVGRWVEYEKAEIMKGGARFGTGARFGILAKIGRSFAYVVTNGPRPRLERLEFDELLNPCYRRARFVEISRRLELGRTFGITKGARRGLLEARRALRAEKEARSGAR